tara:strand:+ start:43 stop:213 length:171 start_codon:yes stop_codon:yes gene_type:complete
MKKSFKDILIVTLTWVFRITGFILNVTVWWLEMMFITSEDERDRDFAIYQSIKKRY